MIWITNGVIHKKIMYGQLENWNKVFFLPLS